MLLSIALLVLTIGALLSPLCLPFHHRGIAFLLGF